jgi:hypothetical protein
MSMTQIRILLVWLLVFTLSPYALGWALDPVPRAQVGMLLYDLPFAGTTGATYVTDVTTQGDVLGLRQTATTTAPYLLQNTTTTSTFACAEGATTEPQARNRLGQTVGTCRQPQGTTGFLYDPARRRAPVTFIRPPQASISMALGLNDTGTIVGAYFDAQGLGPWGFLRTPRGAVVTVQPPGLTGVALLGLNNAGLAVGYALTPDGLQHGVLWLAGHPMLLDVPGSLATVLADINDAGHVVGTAVLPEGQGISVLYRDAQFFLLEAPLANTVYTDVTSINNLGQLGGRVVVRNGDAPSQSLGLVLTPLSAEVAGLASAPVTATRATLHPGEASETARQAQAGVRVTLDPCAAEDSRTLVPLRVRGLCRH